MLDLPKSNIEAEKCVIACVMAAPANIQREIYRRLKPKAFHLKDHEIIWEAIGEVLKNIHTGMQADAVLIRQQLKESGSYEETGGAAYLAELLLIIANETIPGWSNWEQYVQIVKDCAAARYNESIGADLVKASRSSDLTPLKAAMKARDDLDRYIRREVALADRGDTSARVSAELQAEADGKRRNVPWPWPMLTMYMRSNLPGSIAVEVSDPGVGKTFGALQSGIAWTTNGIPYAIRAMERNRQWHGRRVLALLTGDFNVLDDAYIRSNPDKYRRYLEQWSDVIDAVGANIHDNTESEGSSIDDLIAWVDRRCEAGDRMILIDPFTAVTTEERRDVDHERFMESSRRSIERSGSTLVLLTHPRPGLRDKPPTLDDIAGGRALRNFSDSIFWIRRNEKPQLWNCITELSHRTEKLCDVDRYFQILKAREGRGENMRIAARMEINDGGLKEIGVMKSPANDEQQRDFEIEKCL